MDTVIIGIDPGEVTGIAKLRLRPSNPAMPPWRHVVSVDYAQVTSGLVIPVLHGIKANVGSSARIKLATERFVVGPRAGRSSTPKAGTVARDVVILARAWAQLQKFDVVERSAADVKPWATDERLDKAGMLAPAQRMRHAKDGGRHALYEACKSHGVADPLSARARAL